MRIGIDIDNTLCMTDILANELYEKKYNKSFFELNKYNRYKFIAKNYKKIFSKVKLFPNAKSVIDDLSINNEIYIITARTEKWVPNIYMSTKNYLIKKKINYKEIYFNLENKIDMYKKLKLDIMLDDDIDIYNEFKKEGLNICLFKSNINSNIKENKVNSWLEFKDYIERM